MLGSLSTSIRRNGKVGDKLSEHNGKKIIVTGYATIKDGAVTLLFDANELIALLKETTTYKENSTLQMMASVIQSYPGIKVGATARKN